ncbi:aminotransferase class I/II-fold pyridoxal phosphate-dependent enzyme [Dietzia sp. CQ4]|uniref:aminotransferase class I/II-fold pyridoxal phosphate-dependent enzyme n=1 Tax=Dietzia sp. (strain CQ4) TaxID=370437 RepID=UPI0015FA0D6A|nr:aminotransferase class I/II-fold pyridoxal phosphate-dependent enzyme [Dietzia sp. CQ4]MBB1035305.1 aminotransferase class I/II-fold pyridoxal phosphate-dependent enzyme [Dietzia sp. CQ4]
MSVARTPSLRSAVEPFHVMSVLAAAARRQETHGDVISLCAGQPSTPAPGPVLEAARRAVDGEILGYTEAIGIRPLREAIADHHRRVDGVEVTADDVVVTTGSSGGFTVLFLAAFDPGDTVVMARPGYPAYRNTLQALGCLVHEIACGPGTRYQPTVAQLEAVTAELGHPPAGLIVASPANPTGTIIDAAELAALARWCEAHGTLLVSDEIYHGVTYGRECASAWRTSRESVVMGSVSKYFSMTGWRIGWMLLPRYLSAPVDRLIGNLTICPPAHAQFAAVAAFTEDSAAELDSHVERYARNRELVLRRLAGLGVGETAPPDGAFYTYFDVSQWTDDSVAWCAEILERTGVALTPGVDFDTVDGRHTVRLSFAGDTAEIAEAMDRLEAVLVPRQPPTG